jgi:2-amino-4-hydroxy-6-hydroxymethyldihydropteridine diphosphokinase
MEDIVMRCGIALGSNLGDRLANLRAGRDAVMRLPDVNGPLLSSKVYETEPVDTGSDTGRFLNAVIEIEFAAEPEALLAELQRIESAMGRPSRRPRNSPRTLDLDILYAGDRVLANERLEIPHPRMAGRRFVLVPLNDIRPDLRPPGWTKTVGEALADLMDPAEVELFAPDW